MPRKWNHNEIGLWLLLLCPVSGVNHYFDTEWLSACIVSALLEVARILSGFDTYHSIIFVLFSGEEQGKWGSTHYKDLIDKTDVDLDLLISLDMVSFDSEGTNNFLIEYDNGNVVQDK